MFTCVWLDEGDSVQGDDPLDEATPTTSSSTSKPLDSDPLILQVLPSNLSSDGKYIPISEECNAYVHMFMCFN